MRRVFLFLTIIFLASLSRTSGQVQPYQPGEKVSYNVRYGILSGGAATLEIKNDTIFGKDVLYALLSGRTTGVADAIFRLRDYYHSYFDPDTDLPLKAIRNINEGRYHRYNELVYDHYSRTDSAIVQSKLTGTHITPPNIFDIISCFYHLRKNFLAKGAVLKEGDVIEIVTWFTDELYPIRLRFKGYETVKTPLGKIECLMFNPVTEVGRLFKTEDDMSIWFSNDGNYLPVKIRFDIFVGRITVDIEEYEGLVYPLKTINK